MHDLRELLSVVIEKNESISEYMTRLTAMVTVLLAMEIVNGGLSSDELGHLLSSDMAEAVLTQASHLTSLRARHEGIASCTSSPSL